MKSELRCEYCGKIRETNTFVIGYSPEVKWTMWEGTGNVSCDCKKCYEEGKAESAKVMNKHLKRNK